MHIEWNKVTWYSKLLAIILFVGVFWLGFYLGQQYGFGQGILSRSEKTTEVHPSGGLAPKDSDIINDVFFVCPQEKVIHAIFYTNRSVDLELPDSRKLSLPQTISASGARYANNDESFVFWNKGDSAFIEEGGKTTYDACIIDPSGR